MISINDVLAVIELAQASNGSLASLYQEIGAMASSGKTPLGLNRWVDTDKPKMEDFNQDNEILDREISSLKEKKANINNPEFITGITSPQISIKDSGGQASTISKFNSLDILNVSSNELRVNNHAVYNTGNLPVETGAWVPVLEGANTAGVYNATTNCRYYRIGNLCFISMVYLLQSVSQTGVGRAVIKGLPFTTAHNTWGTISVAYLQAATGTDLRMHTTSGNTFIGLSDNVGTLDISKIPTGFSVYASGCYHIVV